MSAQDTGTTRLFLKISAPIGIDGVLSEQAWKSAPEANGLLRVPVAEEGTPAEPTSVKVLFDDTMIYVGFLCQNSRPDSMTAVETARDSDLRADESVYVLLEASTVEKTLFLFGLNLNGTQADGQASADGMSLKIAWDGPWTSAVRRMAAGWSAEMAIDVRGLVPAGKRQGSFGLRLVRLIPRLAPSFWQGPLDPIVDAESLTQANVLVITSAASRKRLTAHLMPMAGSGDLPATGAGIDASLALGENIQARGVLNPDFVTVEPDREVINLTRFELYYPEKRDFFGRGAETFDQPLRLFYSKRIGSIWGGAVLTGMTGPYELYALSVQSKADDLLDEDSANFSVVRLKRSLGPSSSLGLLAANKWQDGLNQGVFGLDGSVQVSKTIRFIGQAALGYGRRRRENTAFILGPSVDTSNFHFHITYSHIGRLFGDNVNAVGFIPDDNRKEVDAGLNKGFSLKSKTFQQLRYFSRYNVYWGTDNTLRSWEVLQGLAVDLPSKFSLGVSYFREYKLYEKEFRNSRIRLFLDFNAQAKWQAVSLAVTFGENFEYPFDIFEVSKRLRLSQNIDLEYALAYIRYSFARFHPDYNNGFLHGLMLSHAVKQGSFLRAVLQYRSRKVMSTKANPENPQGGSSEVNLRRVHFQVFYVAPFWPPYGSVQVGYQTAETDFGVPEPEGNAVYIKLIAAF